MSELREMIEKTLKEMDALDMKISEDEISRGNRSK